MGTRLGGDRRAVVKVDSDEVLPAGKTFFFSLGGYGGESEKGLKVGRDGRPSATPRWSLAQARELSTREH